MTDTDNRCFDCGEPAAFSEERIEGGQVVSVRYMCKGHYLADIEMEAAGDG